MMERYVWGFFYGSYMNFDVLAEVDIKPVDWSKATLSGFSLFFNPRANLKESDTGSVFGINAKMTHSELSRLYQHADEVLGETYLPEAVLTKSENGVWVPALCYISPNQEEAVPESAYVDRIANPCSEYGFPAWYVEHLESFKAR